MTAATTAEPRLHHVQCLAPEGLHRMAYWEWGDATNPRVLVCVHGLSRQGRDFDAGNQDGGQSHEGEKDEQAEPSRCPHQGQLVMVMNVVLLFHPFYMMEDVAMQEIFDQAPAGKARDQSYQREHPPMWITREGEHDQGGGGGRVGVKIGKKGGSAQA